jgi:hypothetical protein
VASLEDIERAYADTILHVFTSRYLAAYRNIFCVLSDRLDELCKLPAGWNSYGSPAPTEVATDNARLILQRLNARDLAPEGVYASGDGGVAFAFVSDTISRAEIESLNTGESYVLLYDLNGNSETLDWPAADKDQLATIECLVAHLRSPGLAAQC